MRQADKTRLSPEAIWKRNRRKIGRANYGLRPAGFILLKHWENGTVRLWISGEELVCGGCVELVECLAEERMTDPRCVENLLLALPFPARRIKGSRVYH